VISQLIGWILVQVFPKGQQITVFVPVLFNDKQFVPDGQHQLEGCDTPQFATRVGFPPQVVESLENIP
jgi:hypothetical protein